MEFELDECAFVYIRGSQIQEAEHITLLNSSCFEPLPLKSQFKYSDIHQTLKIDQKEVEQLFEDQLNRRLKLILESYLYPLSRTAGINAWVLPVVQYSFGIVK